MKSLPRLGSVPTTISCSSVVCTTRSQSSHLNKRSQSPPIGEIIRGGVRGGSPRPSGVRNSMFLSSTRAASLPLSSLPVSPPTAVSGCSGGCGFRHSGTTALAGNNRVKQRQLRKVTNLILD